jgi:hypothetical protein
MSITAETAITRLYGTSVNNLAITMTNVNCNPSFGSDNSSTPTCIEYINQCLRLYPSLLKSYNDRKQKQKDVDTLDIADEIFVPVWISPSTVHTLKYPKEFGGDHRTESLFEKIGVYSTEQILPKYTNGNLCTALSNKIKFSSIGASPTTDKVLQKYSPTNTDVEYMVGRGILSNAKNDSDEYIRYIAMYQRSNNKIGVNIFSGCLPLMTGVSAIFSTIQQLIEKIRECKPDTNYKGITLASIQAGAKPDVVNSYEYNSIYLTRLIAGSILIHDQLLMLRTVYGIKNVLQYDCSQSQDLIKISIDEVVNMYKPIKEYFVMAKCLNQIK